MSTNCVTVRGCLLRAPKPCAVLENGSVHFRRIPPEMRTGLEFGAAAEIAGRPVRPIKIVGRSRQRNDAPFRGAADTTFIAHPAAIRSFAENDRTGLEMTDQIKPCLVIVGFVDARIGIRAIEPDFPNRPVFREQLVKLVQEVTIVVVHDVGVALETRRRRAT